MRPLHRLATYGTLAPGRPNHRQLDGLEGRWWQGKVNGVLLDAGWGASLGYPGLVLDPNATAVDVHVFESADLPAHWARLDAFEGRGYQRAVTTVQAPDGDVEASIYVLLEQSHRRARTEPVPLTTGQRDVLGQLGSAPGTDGVTGDPSAGWSPSRVRGGSCRLSGLCDRRLVAVRGWDERPPSGPVIRPRAGAAR